MLNPGPSKDPGSACLTLPKRRIWRRSLAKNVLWHMVELSHTTATCLRALVIATFIRLLSPRNPTAPNVLDRTCRSKRSGCLSSVTYLSRNHNLFPNMDVDA